MIKPLQSPVRDTRARATDKSCFPWQTTTRSLLRFSALPTLLLLRATRLKTVSTREIILKGHTSLRWEARRFFFH
jgi:hypothetical protein